MFDESLYNDLNATSAGLVIGHDLAEARYMDDVTENLF